MKKSLKLSIQKILSFLVVAVLLLSSLVVLWSPTVQAASLPFSDSFASGDTSEWDAVLGTLGTGNISVVSDPVFDSDGYALQVQQTNAESRMVQANFTETLDEVYVRTYFYLDTAPPDGYNTEVIIIEENGHATDGFSLRVLNTGGVLNWQLRDDLYAQTNTSTATLNVETWYCVEWHFSKTASVNNTVTVNGTLVIDWDKQSIYGADYCRIGLASGWAGSNAVFDAVVIDTEPIGELEESEASTLSFTSPSTNSSTPNSVCQFSATRTTNASSGFHWLESNITETMTNGTAVAFSGNGTSSFTGTLPNDNCTVQWRIIGNTTYGESATDWQNLTVQTVYYVVATSGNVLDIQAAIDNVVAHNVWYPQNYGLFTLGTVIIPAGTWEFWNATQQALGQYPTVNVTLGVNIFGAGYSGNGTEIDAQGNALNIPTDWETVLTMPFEVPGTWGSPQVWFNLGCGGANFPSFEGTRTNYSRTIRVSGLKLQGYRSINESSTTMHTAFAIYGLSNYRIDHCSIENCANGGVAILAYGGENYYTSGVIDHCRIYNTAGYDVLASYGNGNIGYGVNVQRQAYGSTLDMWENLTDVMGKYINGTTFIENCYFSRWRHITSGQNSYYVFRYNYVSGDMGHFTMDVHGLRDLEEGRLGGRGIEVYECRFVNATTYPGSEGYSEGLFQFAGGCGAWFNNYVDDSYSIAVLLNEDVQSDLCRLNDFYLWSDLSNWNSSVTNSVVDPESRHVRIEWDRDAGVYGDESYPNVNASWSISWYEPYAYPHFLTLDDGEIPEFTYTLEVSPVTPEESSTLESSTLNYEFTTSGNDTLSVTQVALYYSNYTQVDSNQTSLTGTFNDLVNETYIIACSVTGVNGAADYLEVSFTVAFVEDTYTLEISSVSPEENATITSSTLNYEFTNTGNDTVSTVQVALYLSNGTQVGTNQTSLTGAFTGLTNNTYMLACSAAGVNGATDYTTVNFTVAIPPEPEPTPSAPTGGPGGVTGETYTVTIIVHNSSKVLGNVEVRLGNLYAYTDSEGKATFVGVVAGFYELKVYVEGQVKYENIVDVEGDKTVMVDLNKPGQPPVDVGEVDVSGFGFEVPVWVIIGFIGVLFAMLAFSGRGSRRRRNR